MPPAALLAGITPLLFPSFPSLSLQLGSGETVKQRPSLSPRPSLPPGAAGLLRDCPRGSSPAAPRAASACVLLSSHRPGEGPGPWAYPPSGSLLARPSPFCGLGNCCPAPSRSEAPSVLWALGCVPSSSSGSRGRPPAAPRAGVPGVRPRPLAPASGSFKQLPGFPLVPPRRLSSRRPVHTFLPMARC